MSLSIVRLWETVEHLQDDKVAADLHLDLEVLNALRPVGAPLWGFEDQATRMISRQPGENAQGGTRIAFLERFTSSIDEALEACESQRMRPQVLLRRALQRYYMVDLKGTMNIRTVLPRYIALELLMELMERSQRETATKFGGLV